MIESIEEDEDGDRSTWFGRIWKWVVFMLYFSQYNKKLLELWVASTAIHSTSLDTPSRSPTQGFLVMFLIYSSPIISRHYVDCETGNSLAVRQADMECIWRSGRCIRQWALSLSHLCIRTFLDLDRRLSWAVATILSAKQIYQDGLTVSRTHKLPCEPCDYGLQLIHTSYWLLLYGWISSCEDGLSFVVNICYDASNKTNVSKLTWLADFSACITQ